MLLVSRYTPSVYLFGFFVSAIITIAVNALVGVGQLVGHDIAPISVLGFYTSFVNIAFYMTTGISIIIGTYVVLATAVQMSMIEFWPANIDKEDQERRRLVRGMLMTFFCVVMSAASWAMTKSAQNVALGSPVASEYFVGPFVIAALFYCLVLTQWPQAARMVR